MTPSPFGGAQHLFYGNLQANARALICQAENALRAIDRGVDVSKMQTIVSLHNRAALDQLRSGRWERAFHLTSTMLGVLETERVLHRLNDGAAAGAFRATCQLNLGRLWSARGDCAMAARSLDALAHAPDARLDVLLPEYTRCYLQSAQPKHGLTHLQDLERSLGVRSDQHFARARAVLLSALGDWEEAGALQDQIEADQLSPIDRCWFVLERLEVSRAGDRGAPTESLLRQASLTIEQLLADSDPRASVPLVLALELARREANCGHAQASAIRLRHIAERAGRGALEGLWLRAAVARLGSSVGCAVVDVDAATHADMSADIERLEQVSLSSRYWIEVLQAWSCLGQILITSASPADLARGFTYLARVARDEAVTGSPVTRSLATQARQLLGKRDGHPVGDDSTFFANEPEVLSRCYLMVSSLSERLGEA